VRAFLHRRLHEAVALHERALSLNPNLAMAWALSAVAYTYLGDPEEAERRHNRYKKLSPLDPHAFFFDAFFVLIRLQKRDYESAVAVARAVMEMNPSFSATYKPYLSALGHLGRSQEAAVIRLRLQGIEPNFTVQRCIATSPLERERDRDHYVTGLRLAGVPENVAGAAERLQDPQAHVAV
jgi:tetratricopeptide (TPR) repeat protein